MNRRANAKSRAKLLKKRLDELYVSYDRSYLHSDPLQFPHRYRDKRNREIVAFIASTLAYGNVSTIKNAVERILAILGVNPCDALVSREPRDFLHALEGFKHRFTTAKHMAWVLLVISRVLAEYGSLKKAFLAGYVADDTNIRAPLTSFVERLLQYGPEPIYPSVKALKKDGALFLLPSPRSGAACKRLNLFLRWVVRTADDIDLGLWPEVTASKLVIPLDTHIARISRRIGLTDRKSSDWKTAEDITNTLRTLDPEDPLKYDFSLTRLGILGDCGADRRGSRCRTCRLADVCVTGAETARQ